MSNPKVVFRYEPPIKTQYQFEGQGFPFARLTNALRLLEHEMLAAQEGGALKAGTGVVPASVTLEWDAEAEEVLTTAEGYFPPYLLVHVLSMAYFDVIGRQQQAILMQRLQEQQNAIQAATPMLPPRKLIH